MVTPAGEQHPSRPNRYSGAMLSPLERFYAVIPAGPDVLADLRRPHHRPERTAAAAAAAAEATTAAAAADDG